MAKSGRSKFTKCPAGHQLPHVTKRGSQCTPLLCAEEVKREAPELKEVRLASTKVPVLEDEAEDLLFKRKLAARASQREQRRELVPTIEAKDAAEAEAWADDKIVKLLPKAVAELEYQLEYGSDEQRERAANKILDANGRGKQEKGGAGAAPIILLNMQPGQLPWMQRVEKKEPQTIALPVEKKNA